MTTIWDEAVNVANYYWFDLAEPHVYEYPFWKYPWPAMPIVIAWYYFSMYGGRQFMKNRKPYDLSRIMIFYNAFQCACNLYMFVYVFYLMPYWQYSYFCIPFPRHDKFWRNKLLDLGYMYVGLKYVDLIDTVFMVLRKNYHQITFLHMFHHLSMAVGTWLYARYVSDGTACVIVIPNMGVHALMYLYYLLAAKSSAHKNSITWKKTLTRVQMLQFLVVFFWVSAALRPSCDINKFWVVFFMCYSVIFFYLFYQFYYNAYIKPKTVTSNQKNK